MRAVSGLKVLQIVDDRFGDGVALEVDFLASAELTQGGFGEGRGDQGDFEPALGRGDVGDGQGDALDADAALGRQVGHEVGWRRDAGTPLAIGIDGCDLAHAVYVALDQVAPEEGCEGRGRFEVDAGTDAQAAQGSFGEGFGDDVEGEGDGRRLVVGVLGISGWRCGEREAAAIKCDGFAQSGGVGPGGDLNEEAFACVRGEGSAERAEMLDQAGEHETRVGDRWTVGGVQATGCARCKVWLGVAVRNSCCYHGLTT